MRTGTGWLKWPALSPLHCLRAYSVDEAARLRDAGISGSIFIMGPIESAGLQEALGLWLPIRAVEHRGVFARRLPSRPGAPRPRRGAREGRYRRGAAGPGFPRRARCDRGSDARLPESAVTGIFSHLAAAEELDSPFTMEQLRSRRDASGRSRSDARNPSGTAYRSVGGHAALAPNPPGHGSHRHRRLRTVAFAANPHRRDGANLTLNRPLVHHAHRSGARGRSRTQSGTDAATMRRKRLASRSFPWATPTAFRACSRTAARSSPAACAFPSSAVFA